jgi:hypothetical protein
MNIVDDLLIAAQAHKTTGNLIALFGARLAGTSSCWKTAEYLKNEFHIICGSSKLEPFETHPAAFLGFFKIHFFLYCASLLFLHSSQPIWAAFLMTIIVFSGFLEFGYYKEIFDRFFPKKICANVVAHLEPQGSITRQVIISGHHDSAQELVYLRGNQKFYAIKVLLPDILFTIAFVFSWVWVVYLYGLGYTPAYVPVINWFLTLGLFIAKNKFFMVSEHGTPGAGDNLIASCILLELAKVFSSQTSGKSNLQHTRLTFISFDAEESGLRGARAYVKRHRDELETWPTTMLNIDSIYHESELKFLTSDINHTVALSPQLAEKCVQIARSAGYQARAIPMIFGGGGTDAAEFARVGVEATTMLAMSTDLVRNGLVYHTMQDTVDKIELGAVQACLRVAVDLVEEIDSQKTE